MLSASSAGGVLFTKIYPHISTYQVCGFEFLRIMYLRSQNDKGYNPSKIKTIAGRGSDMFS